MYSVGLALDEDMRSAELGDRIRKSLLGGLAYEGSHLCMNSQPTV